MKTMKYSLGKPNENLKMKKPDAELKCVTK
jgi:hypothetical protein